MQLHQRLNSCGMSNVASALGARASRMTALGVDVGDQIFLLTHEERASLEHFENRSRNLKGVQTTNDLLEFDRLTVLVSRATGEAVSWLRSLSLERLRQMMDAVE
jgi:hypothetical protein